MQEALHGLDIGRNDRVALALPPGPELAVALLGVASTATCVLMNPADEHVGHLHVKAVILPFGAKDKAHADVHRHGIPVLEVTPVPETEAGFFALNGHTHLSPAAQKLPHDDDLALILPPADTGPYAQSIYVTHANLSLVAWQVAARLKLETSDSCLSLVPPFQSHGLVAGLLASLIVGATVVCPPDFQAETFFSGSTFAALHGSRRSRACTRPLLAMRRNMTTGFGAVRSASSAPLHPLRFGRPATPCDPGA